MRSLLVPAALAAAALAACGGSSSSGAKASTLASSKPVAAPAAAAAKSATVRIDDFAYKPKTLRVKVGTHVTWNNVDKTNHTVTFHGHGAPGSVDNLKQGKRVVRTFSRAGTFKYVCEFHPFMHGTVVVSR